MGWTAMWSQLIPEDASTELQLSPVASQWCARCSLISLGIAALVHVTCDYSDKRAPVPVGDDPGLHYCHNFAAIMSLAGLMYEACIRASIGAMGLTRSYQADPSLRSRLELNVKMMIVFGVLTTTYHVLSFELATVHEGWLAAYHGGKQIVYSNRYVEWVLCSPLVFMINGHLSSSDSSRSSSCGLIWSGVLTGAYCLNAWQGLVVKDALVAWLLIGWSFFAYALAAAEQLYFAAHIAKEGAGGKLRAGLLVYIVVVCGIYGIVYLLPIAGWLSPTLENKFYCFADTSFKLGTSIMVIASYDIGANDSLRRRAEVAAEDMHRLIDTASVPIFGINEKREVDQWNQKAHSLTGYSPEEAVGRSIFDMLAKDAQEPAKSMIEDTLLGKTTSYLEAKVVKPSSKEGERQQKASLILSASARRNADGDITGVTLVGCDVTEVEAFREAEARKQRFMAVVSHELRSPLHGIIGLADQMQSNEDDPQKARWLRMVKSCASRLLDLVVNIMEMAALAQKDSKGSQKSLKLQRDPVELPKVIDEIITLVSNSVDKSGSSLVKPGVKLLNSVASKLPIIEADAHRCMQVFYNLVTNACKFTTKGQVDIVSRVDPLGRWVEVSVEDTGVGIPASSLERIFLPFEQEDSSDTRHFQGVGLGLSIAQEVVKLHGGYIKVESTVGEGASFRVRLPIVMGTDISDCPPAPEAVPSVSEAEAADAADVCTSEARSSYEPEVTRPKQGPGSKPLVLSVDDDDINQSAVEAILSSEYEVRSATDGLAALEYLETCDKDNFPDCVLLGSRVEGVSGFEVVRNIRQKMKLDHTMLPVIMSSSTGNEPQEQTEAINSGCNGYVAKPFDKEKLHSAVGTALSLKIASSDSERL